MPGKDMKKQQKCGDWNLCAVKRQFKYRRPICPFICSTFQDFQIERDILVKKVFPTIDALCRERGTFCTPVDLRWGINDSQVRSGQVINLCLDYVTKCAPFFICILGERFGSHRPHDAPPIPESYRDLPANAHWMDRNLAIASASGYDWVTTDRYVGSSVTALEVAQRNFLSEKFGDEFSFYYFRQQEHLDYLFTDLAEDEREQKLKVYEPESEHCNQEIRDLKARIVKRGITVRYFKTPEELQQLVLDDWLAVVNKLYPPLYQDIPDIHRESVMEWMAHEAFAESRRRVFVRTPEHNQLFSDLTKFALTSLEDPPPNEENTILPTYRSMNFSCLLRKKRLSSIPPSQSVFLLVGERGCGKSSVISNWYQEFSEGHTEVKVITHYVGCNAHSTDVHALMRRFTHEIRHAYPDFQGTNPAGGLNSANNDEVSNFHNVCEAFHAALRLGPCVLVIDGIDELGETYGCSNNLVKEMSWLPCPLPAQCKVILTSAQSDTSHKALSLRDDTNTVTVPLLKNTTSKFEVIKQYLAIHCKCLEDKQLERIVSCKLSDRPIFLSVLANELRVFGVYSHLDVHLDSYLEAMSVRDLWSKIVQRWTRDYGWVVDEKTDKPGTADKSTEGGEAERPDLSGWVADALRLLTVSRSGLSRYEILDLLQQMGYRGNKTVTMLDWAMFRSAAMDSLLERPGGLINFFHQHFKEAVEHTLFGSATPNTAHTKHSLVQLSSTDPNANLEQNPTKKPKYPPRAEYHRHIAKYFLNKEHCCRRSEELPWQLERAGEFDTLAGVLSEPRLFLEMAGDRIMHRKRLELVTYWQILQEAGLSVVDSYWAMLRRAIRRKVLDAMVDPEENDGNDAGARNGEEHTDICRENNKNASESTQALTIASIRAHNHAQNVKSGPSSLSRGPPSVRQQIPKVIHTSPSDNSLSSLSHSERNLRPRSAGGLTDISTGSRTSMDSTTSNVTATSFASSVDSSEAYIDGQARGPKEAARLTMITGQFLTIMSHFVDAERMLLTAHQKLSKCAFSSDGQRLLCGLEESIGNMYLYQLRKDEAARWYNLGLRTVDGHLAVLRDSTSEAGLLEIKGRLLDQLGNMKTYSREFKEAEEMLMRAKHCFEKCNSTIGKAIVYYHIGFLKMQQGIFDNAEVLFLDTLSSLERWFGKNHPRVAEVLNDLATLLCHPDNKQSYDPQQAESFYRRALQIRESCFGSDHLLVATILFHLGKLLKGQKTKSAQSESLMMLRRALDIRTNRLGEKHGLTKAVRRTLNALEVSLQTKNKPAPDTRSDDLPYSQLTWHENDLREFEMKAWRKKVELEEKQMQKEVKIDAETKGTVQIVVGEHVDQNELIENGDAQGSDVDVFQDIQESKTSSARTNEENSREIKHTYYIDSYVNEMSTRNNNQTRKALSTQSQIKLRPKSAPVTAFSVLSTRNDSSLNALHTTRPSVPNGYSSSTPSRRRLKSAPVHAPLRRVSFGSESVHRRTCSIPGPHTIDKENSKCTIVGPNMTLFSLLDLPEKPRYSATATGIHHTSAWYHVPGRYPTVERPYPRKRLQKRPNLPRNYLHSTRENKAWMTSHGDKETPGTSSSPTSRETVHFGLQPTVTAANLVASH